VPQNPWQRNLSLIQLLGLEAAHGDYSLEDDILDMSGQPDSSTSNAQNSDEEEDKQGNLVVCEANCFQPNFGKYLEIYSKIPLIVYRKYRTYPPSIAFYHS